MHLSCLLALLGATGFTFALPVSSNLDQLESSPQDLDKRFYYTHYVAPEKRDEEALDKRFFYLYDTAPEKQKRDEEALDKRFFYTAYQGAEKRDGEAADNEN
ncbi:uncharacterized protein BO72DRAFT_462368 [Aspergillus fijiensis CBS 313.89]|uniref:Uncharacterized protein n=1 Tax=Aspergillus fijiensis CBS 313.89 TaxID=1448319 RepID=A0A8G1RH28_9EURO|nr:uncharacterized protein BO72DRAFT_462368 [Aspergillus fijiensis CBS 313.89]RAK73205.1 hypothetical protein BO72DRAFT_462368 [Aspergillus fijiensis CBS 313.89]